MNMSSLEIGFYVGLHQISVSQCHFQRWALLDAFVSGFSTWRSELASQQTSSSRHRFASCCGDVVQASEGQRRGHLSRHLTDNALPQD